MYPYTDDMGAKYNKRIDCSYANHCHWFGRLLVLSVHRRATVDYRAGLQSSIPCCDDSWCLRSVCFLRLGI